MALRAVVLLLAVWLGTIEARRGSVTTQGSINVSPNPASSSRAGNDELDAELDAAGLMELGESEDPQSSSALDPQAVAIMKAEVNKGSASTGSDQDGEQMQEDLAKIEPTANLTAYQSPGVECDPTCRTCFSKSEQDCTSCEGETRFLKVKRVMHLDSSSPAWAVPEEKRIWMGPCMDATEGAEMKAGVSCVSTACYDPLIRKRSGISPRPRSKEIVCTRICMLGGDATKVKDLQCKNAGPCKDTTKSDSVVVPVPREYRSTDTGLRSSPVCLFHKVTKCKNTSSKSREKCDKGNKYHCESCTVQKEVRCHAVVASNVKLPHNYTAAEKRMCEYAINPCGNIPRLF